MKRTNRAALRLCLCMAVFGTISIFVKGIDLPASEIALYRAAIAGVVLFFYLAATGRLGQLKNFGRDMPLLFLSGAAMGFNWIFLFTAYRYTTVALSTLAYYFSPTLVVLGSLVLFRERLTLRQILCFLGSTAGLVLIVGVRGGGSGDLTGLLFGLLAAVLYAAVILCNKRTARVDGVVRTWVQLIAAVLVIAPYVALMGGFHIASLSAKGWANLLVIGAGFTGLLYAVYFSAVARLPGQQAAILSYIDPAVSVLVSVFWLREPITALQILGGVLILAFAMANELGRPAS